MLSLFIVSLLFTLANTCTVDSNITVTGDVNSVLCNTSLCSLQDQLDCIKTPINQLYVSKGANCTVPDGIHFNTISAAMVRAAELVPTGNAMVTIFIDPGTYTEDVTVVSNTVMQGVYQSTFICGTVSWLASTGVNTIYTPDIEVVFMNDLILASSQFFDQPCGTLIMSTVAKPNLGVDTTVGLSYVVVSQETNVTMRSFPDLLQTEMCTFMNPFTLVNVGTTLLQYTVFQNAFFLAQTQAVVIHCYFDDLFISDTTFMVLYSVTVIFNTNFTNAFSMARESSFVNVDVKSGTQLSILGCAYTTLTADGTSNVDRDLSTYVIAADLGSNLYVFPIPYINAPSFVAFTQTSGTFSYPPIVNGITNTVLTFESAAITGTNYTIAIQNHLLA